MGQLDCFIDAAINRLSGDQGSTVSNFYVDLRSFQQRITQNLVDQCVSICQLRGLFAERHGDGLSITVDLQRCSLNPTQAAAYSLACSYTRIVHGNHL